MLASINDFFFSEDKKQHYYEDLVSWWAVLQKTVFNH